MELTERSILPIDIDQNRARRHRVNGLILDRGEVITEARMNAVRSRVPCRSAMERQRSRSGCEMSLKITFP